MSNIVPTRMMASMDRDLRRNDCRPCASDLTIHAVYLKVPAAFLWLWYLY
ncbi:hypothetical protein LGM46_31785 [Burkholderia arboris]|nr:hypothetical protein [Burkholderia arboris]MCA8037554.1 hypothetical protein [Burkholderia arboris]